MSRGKEGSFVLEALPGTDLWRKPPSTDRTNTARKILEKLPLQKLQSSRITFNASWTRQYDQGGLLLWLTGPTLDKPKWIKAGVEYYNGQPFLSTVGCDNWADWSIAPLSTQSPQENITVEMRREGDEHGKSLWVYQILTNEDNEDTGRLPLREINWVLAEEAELTVEVAAYAARPKRLENNEEDAEALTVQFESWAVRTR